MEGRWQRGESLPGLPAEHYDLFPDRLVPSELGDIPEEPLAVVGLPQLEVEYRTWAHVLLSLSRGHRNAGQGVLPMSRRLRQHLLAAELGDLPLGKAACGRIIGRRRLIVPSRPARWLTVVQLGVGCHDCQRSALAAALKV